MCQKRRRCSAVADGFSGPLGCFPDHLCPEVLFRILEFHFLGDRDPVVADEGPPNFSRSALTWTWSQCHSHGVGKDTSTSQDALTGIRMKLKLFSGHESSPAMMQARCHGEQLHRECPRLLSMKLTLSVIKADIGSIGGHVAPQAPAGNVEAVFEERAAG